MVMCQPQRSTITSQHDFPRKFDISYSYKIRQCRFTDTSLASKELCVYRTYLHGSLGHRRVKEVAIYKITRLRQPV